MKTRNQLQTIAVAYAEMCSGIDPWVALGNFLHDWYDEAKDRRELLVADPVVEAEQVTQDLHRWAAFCAATVEWLCQRYEITCPGWVNNRAYILREPWFYYPQEYLRERLIQQTPEEFTRRNIYCGNRMFANKYEFAEQFRRSA